MNRSIIILTLPLTLIGCGPSAEVRKAAWINFCMRGEFTQAQCKVLYSLKESSDDARDNAAISSMMSGVAVGISSAQRR